METAIFNNRIVSVGVFQRLRTSPSDRAICPVCGEEVFLSAAKSVKKTASFNHLPRGDDEIRCSLSYPYHPKYAWLDNVDLEAIQLRADALKAAFYKLENLKRAFMFLTSLTGKGAVNCDVFALLLRRADKFDIWRYAGLPVWAVPYILLTFTDFYIRRPSKPTYVVRFVIDKPSRSKLNATWLHPGQCQLVKYFVNNGKATKMFGVQNATPGKTSSAVGVEKIKNPLPFSEAEFNQLTTDTSWISGALDNLLVEMAMEPLIEPDVDIPVGSSSRSTTAAPAGAYKDSGKVETRASRRFGIEPQSSRSTSVPHAAMATATSTAKVDSPARYAAEDQAVVPKKSGTSGREPERHTKEEREIGSGMAPLRGLRSQGGQPVPANSLPFASGDATVTSSIERNNVANPNVSAAPRAVYSEPTVESSTGQAPSGPSVAKLRDKNDVSPRPTIYQGHAEPAAPVKTKPAKATLNNRSVLKQQTGLWKWLRSFFRH